MLVEIDLGFASAHRNCLRFSARIGRNVILVCGTKRTRFCMGIQIAWVSVWVVEIDVLSVWIRIELVFVWVVEMGFVSVWGIDIDLISVEGS